MYIAFYVLSILALNLGFSYVPMIETSIGLLSPMAVLAGVVFVLRDFAQREHGHWVLAGMAAGAALSYILADPYVATASVAAFAISELADYALYTITKKPFKDRVLISSLVSTPVDTAVFLFLISGLTLGTFLLMVAAKLLAAFAIWFYYRRRGDDDEGEYPLFHSFE
jgi:uncharacterized PurR-regulated membrane protein YhhQ (DUF165 family)